MSRNPHLCASMYQCSKVSLRQQEFQYEALLTENHDPSKIQNSSQDTQSQDKLPLIFVRQQFEWDRYMPSRLIADSPVASRLGCVRFQNPGGGPCKSNSAFLLGNIWRIQTKMKGCCHLLIAVIIEARLSWGWDQSLEVMWHLVFKWSSLRDCSYFHHFENFVENFSCDWLDYHTE